MAMSFVADIVFSLSTGAYGLRTPGAASFRQGMSIFSSASLRVGVATFFPPPFAREVPRIKSEESEKPVGGRPHLWRANADSRMAARSKLRERRAHPKILPA